VSLGGYASAWELARYHLATNPETARLFGEANPALMDEAARRALVTGRLEGLSPTVRQHLDALSPERAVSQLRARLLIVHGRGDALVPYTESLRLAAAARDLRPRTAIVGLIGHVERSGLGARLADLARLWAVTYELMAR
jgi:fermentation-respiration switch protein FrsA (DUF1100 family)